MTHRFPTVAVLGLGTAGSALALALAATGRQVVGIEQNGVALAGARERLSLLAAETGRQEALDRVECTLDGAVLAGVDLVVEALPERLEVKVDMLTRANARCPVDTVFVTTTTGLSVTEIASRSGRMPRTVGLHVFPATVFKPDHSPELVTTLVTEQAVTDAISELVAELGGTPVVVGDHVGFIGGALLMSYLNNAAAMYEQGYAHRDDIDTAMRLGCGLPTGPLAQMDAIGLDVVHDTLRALHDRTGDRAFAPATIITTMRDGGLHGRKTGRGFYEYDSVATPRESAVRQETPVTTIGIVGAGTMATGIAEVCARAGYRTVLAARSDVRAKEALTVVDASLGKAVKRGKLTEAERTATMDRLTGVGCLDGLAECDLVIEAVTEDLTVKRAIFAELDQVCAPHAVLATSTSSLSVTGCATATSRPQQVVGMHFFNPAPVMKLVEVVRTALTSDQTTATAHAVTASLGRTAVSCGDRAGFIVNALLFPYLNRAAEMLRERWVSAEDVDRVMTGGHGYPMGPLRLLDVIGLDVSLQIQHSLRRAFGEPSLEPARYLADLVEAGYLGRKTGRGFHVHEVR